jgi:tRNA G37 N-methylase Trm5
MADKDNVQEYRISKMEEEWAEIKKALFSMNESLQKLVILDERVVTLLKEREEQKKDIREILDRLNQIEKDLTQSKLVSKYVIIGAVAVLSAVGTAILKLVGLK